MTTTPDAQWRGIQGDSATLFTRDVQGAQLVRLLIACNVLDTLWRGHLLMTGAGRAEKVGDDVVNGDNLVMLLLTTGAFREALDAFHDAKHLFKAVADSDAQRAVSRIEAAISTKKSDPNSFYMRVATHYRVTGGFHWDRNAIEAALKSGKFGSRLMSVPINAAPQSPARYVTGDEVLAQCVLGSGGITQFRKDVAELRDLLAAFLTAVETMMAERFTANGCQFTPP